MSAFGGFDSTKKFLQTLLNEIKDGTIQLPDFQRGWVWDDDRIISLLASISVTFPIGALMMLETGGKGIRFKTRPIEGTTESLCVNEPETLILDGQQRLTSLFQPLMSDLPVKTKDFKNKVIKRWYYFDMNMVLKSNSDREETIISMPEDRLLKAFGGRIKLDLSNSDLEYENHCFPLNSMFNSSEWRQQYNKYWDYDAEKSRLFDKFESEVIKSFEQYQVPVIELAKGTPKEAVCLVFEKVNTGGVSLTVFELLTATFAADNFQLRDDWCAREKTLKETHQVLKKLQSDDFLQAMTLLITMKRHNKAFQKGVSQDKLPGISCKRRDILKLEVNDYISMADSVQEGFIKAARFLHEQKIFKARDLPYRTQLIPLAALFTALEKKAENTGVKRKIARWYWCGIFGELYGGAIETRFSRDLPQMINFVNNDDTELPITIQDANFAANRLLSLRTRNSAAYKGMHAILMRDGCKDLSTGETIEFQTFYDDHIDIHHVFPKDWCIKQGIEANLYNSIINKTPLSARTNRKIGGNAPSVYLEKLEHENENSDIQMNHLLESHRLPVEPLRRDNFSLFFEKRGEELLRCIEEATQMSITRDPSIFKSWKPVDVYDDGPIDWEDEDRVEGIDISQ